MAFIRTIEEVRRLATAWTSRNVDENGLPKYVDCYMAGYNQCAADVQFMLKKLKRPGLIDSFFSWLGYERRTVD